MPGVIGSVLGLGSLVSCSPWVRQQFGLHVLSECGSTYIGPSRPVPEIHWHNSNNDKIIISYNDHDNKNKNDNRIAPNCLQHAHSSGPGAIVCKLCATHRALITCNLQCATWYEGTAQLLSLTELKSHLFQLYFTA